MARAKEFDPDKALEDAMHLFWNKGYHDTSIRDLIERTGVNYYGLYDVFESKHGLFLAALQRYRRLIYADVFSELDGPGTPMQAIRRTFGALVKFLKRSDEHDGCMMCGAMAELAPHDTDVQRIVSDSQKEMAKAFSKVLTLADDSRNARNVRAQAEFLATAVFSVGLLMRSGAPMGQVNRYIDTTLQSVA